MDTYNAATANIRYLILPRDGSNLYRLYAKSLGVDVTKGAQYNIHDWLDSNSPDFKPEIRDTIFHYRERAKTEDRLCICIATQEMNDASWKYAHHSQFMMDGTFGISSSKLLLFIALATDENGKGVPLALFLFSAPTDNRATHAGYDTKILAELLESWRLHLSTTRGEPFKPFVVITDTDTKERGALIQVWPDIRLLLCKVHVQRCWKNKKKQLLSSRGDKDLTGAKRLMWARLRSLDVK